MPFLAFVTTDITFTFSALTINPATAQLLRRQSSATDPRTESDATEPKPIDGLYAAIEAVGDLFANNYLGGAVLTRGTVFGRTAEHHAAS